MKKDYSHLKGTEVTCINHNDTWVASGTKQLKGFVADIDYKKGITIKAKKTQEDLVCLSKYDFDNGAYKWWVGKLTWKKMFERLVSCIEKGRYNQNLICKKSEDSNGASNCAFE